MTELTAADLCDLLEALLWIHVRDPAAYEAFHLKYVPIEYVFVEPEDVQADVYLVQPKGDAAEPLALLDAALKAGHVIGTGRRGGERRIVVPAIEWRDLRLCKWPERADFDLHAFPYGPKPDVTPGAYFYQYVMFDRASLRRAFPASEQISKFPRPRSKTEFATSPEWESAARAELVDQGMRISEAEICRKLAELYDRNGFGDAKAGSFATIRRQHFRRQKRAL